MQLPKGMAIVNHHTNTLVQLYKTLILVIDYKDKTITFNTGGWNTAHTRKCMNIALKSLDFHVKQVKGQLYIIKPNDMSELYHDNITLPII